MDATLGRRATSMRRVFGIAAGIGTQAFFLVTVWFLFWFLKDGGPSDLRGRLWIDALLAMQFAGPHSLLMLPSVQKLLGKWILREFYALFYCVVTCVGVLITIGFWRTSNTILWELHGVAYAVVQISFYASWIALFYSLSLTGLGSQTGWPQWWHWVRCRPMPHSKFRPRGAYLWLRHPVYLSFAGLIWFTPRMTLDHAILTTFWTMYIFVGSFLKDMRLEFYLGDEYRAYQRRVPGFPLMPFGPFARRKAALAAAIPAEDLSKATARRDAA